MKKLWLAATLLFTMAVYGQHPVAWAGTALRQNGTAYLLQLRGTVQPGWQVYAADDAAEGLETVKLHWEDAGILPGSTSYLSAPVELPDAVFDKQCSFYKNDIILEQLVQVNGDAPAALAVSVTGFATDGKTFLPLDDTIRVAMGGTAAVNDLVLHSVDLSHPVSPCGQAPAASGNGLLAIFLLGIGGGLLALLTPCVFPMIPVTVSFFTNTGASRKRGVINGIVYGLSILLIYVLASVPFHLMGNIDPQVFNTISTSVGVNIAFFIIFIVFALAFFGLFNISLPAAAAGKADSRSGKGSFAGIFFMALTLAIVSFSCTGPILGSLLVGSLSPGGGAWQLTAGMAGFGLALALPFALFAMFPGWLKALPRSGGWMETFKKSLAFVELGLAIKFFSNADLVQHWGIMKREIFIGLWILIAVALALYLFGVFEKRKTVTQPYIIKDKVPVRPDIRKAIAVLVLLFAVYLLPGVTKSKMANLSPAQWFCTTAQLQYIRA